MNPFPPHSETDSFSLHRQDLTRLLLLSLALLTVILILQQVVLHDFPNSADEFAYLYQAHTFAEGRLANPAHEFQEFLSPFYILTSQEKVFSLFPPGFPVLLALGVITGIPALVNPLVGVAIIWTLFYLTFLWRGRRFAWITVLLLIGSPMFVFNCASYFAHPVCLLMLILALLFMTLALQNVNFIYLFAAGFCTAFAFITRELTTVALGTLPLLWFLWYSSSRVKSLAGMILGMLPLLIFYLGYNQHLTGNWLMPPRFLQESELYGFGEQVIKVFDYVEVKKFGPAEALSNTAANLIRLMVWTIPGLPLAALYALWKYRSYSLVLAAGASVGLLVVAYFFYPSAGGNQYGARFYFEALGGLCFLGALAVDRILQQETVAGKWGTLILILIWTAVLVLFVNFANFFYNQIEQRIRIFEYTKHLKNAVVFVGAPSGDMTQGDLIRNLPDWEQADVIFAWHLGARNQLLMQALPQREFYIFYKMHENERYSVKRIIHRLGEQTSIGYTE
ncbi:MAG: ArnT family glycosyltransferase [bacterium]|jgi:hypothetical protein